VFLNNEIIETIQADLKSFVSYPNLYSLNKDIKLRFFFKALLDIDYRAIFMYRLSCFFISKGAKKIGLLFYYRLKSAHAIDISPYAKIGPGFKVVHAFNIVIGPEVVLGDNCVCFNSVTIGNSHPGWKIENHDKKKSMPIIGIRATLCPGARIIGNIVVGNDVMIGANSVILSDIPDNETWAGVPAKKISTNIFEKNR
jgi:serine O-acetyltransferase